MHEITLDIRLAEERREEMLREARENDLARSITRSEAGGRRGASLAVFVREIRQDFERLVGVLGGGSRRTRKKRRRA